jgi:hypothetical protein
MPRHTRFLISPGAATAWLPSAGFFSLAEVASTYEQARSER